MGELIQKDENELPAPVTDTSAMIQMIERIANNPQADVDKLERMMAMYERLESKKHEQAFNAAMSFVQSKTARISADATNPQTHSKYASYAALDRVLRPIYTEHGFSLSFDSGEGAPSDWIRVLCYVSHRDGYSRTYHKDLPADGKGAKGGDVMTKTHASGSAVSYAMRYLLKMIFNVAIGDDDDDGNQATVIERVTEEQAQNIMKLILEVGADEFKFLKWMKVSRIEDISKAAYQDAVRALERKRKV